MGDKKGKGISKVPDDDSYEWVNEDVKLRGSLFIDQASVGEISLSNIVRVGCRVELLPCTKSERVFHRKKDFEYFFVYSCLLEELHVKLPFTGFECNVLKQLNCAPSQLHPNGWAFLRSFEILMEYLEIEPTLELFFSLFQAKAVWKGVWVNLNSSPGFGIFKLYKSSFKDFKELFLKVKAFEEDFPFYIDENFGEKFPLYWCCQPQQILGPEYISPRDECIIAFLVELVNRGELISVYKLLPWEQDRTSVINYLGGKYPGVSASNLRARLKTKNLDKEGSSSNPTKVDGDGVVDQPVPVKKNYVFKKRKTDVVNLDSDVVEKNEWPMRCFSLLLIELLWMRLGMWVLGLQLASIGRSWEISHKMALNQSEELLKRKSRLT
ncbi:uncharacterized protein [Arachis hypogaea]|uniref:uncharacterized protein isoform X2 n=1 Tax=Arachis hypogaea TaxID=3818 RepID=UPI000DEC0695|nr:uncharacterized protein LOC112695441 isoform X2 [Arachis hypogaea]